MRSARRPVGNAPRAHSGTTEGVPVRKRRPALNRAGERTSLARRVAEGSRGPYGQRGDPRANGRNRRPNEWCSTRDRERQRSESPDKGPTSRNAMGVSAHGSDDRARRRKPPRPAAGWRARREETSAEAGVRSSLRHRSGSAVAKRRAPRDRNPRNDDDVATPSAGGSRGRERDSSPTSDSP